MTSSLSILLLLAAPLARAASEAEEPLLGTWALDGQEIVVRIERAGAALSGTVVSSAAAALRGTTVLRGLTRNTGGGWSGEIYAPRRADYVPCRVRLGDDGRLTMTAGSGLATKTLTWRRLVGSSGREEGP
jgi:uncharacterized protein (DUF2147 family)